METESLRNQYVLHTIESGWNTRTLQRNITSQYIGLVLDTSKQETPRAQQLIKDPYIFEFLLMRIQIISDLHQEFGISDLNFQNADLVILAGDTNLGTKGIEWVKKYIPNIPVIYILGNHEYYKGSYPNTLHRIREASRGSNVFVLENNRIEIDGIRFHGATLWTDFSLFGNPVEYGIICQTKMNDYKQIRLSPSYSKLRTIDTYKIHQFSKLWLQESLEESQGSKNIVITHHAPSIKSVPESYKNDPVTSAYASDLE